MKMKLRSRRIRAAVSQILAVMFVVPTFLLAGCSDPAGQPTPDDAAKSTPRPSTTGPVKGGKAPKAN